MVRDCIKCWPKICRCIYQPKGSMCMACQHKNDDCSKLPFHEMPRLEGDSDTGIVVRCVKFQRAVTN